MNDKLQWILVIILIIASLVLLSTEGVKAVLIGIGFYLGGLIIGLLNK